jgi:hypothetical protein
MATKSAEVIPLATPEVATDLKPIKATALAIVSRWGGLKRISNEAELEAVAADLVRIEKAANKPAESVRKHLNEPLAEAKNRNDALIRETLTGEDGTYLPDLAAGLRALICEYASRDYMKAARAAQKQLERLEAAATKAAASGLDIPVLPFVPGLASPKRTIKVGDGMVIIGAKLKATVLDANQLPDEFLMKVPNAKAIEAALEAGREVPGVQAQLVTNTTVR